MCGFHVILRARPLQVRLLGYQLDACVIPFY